MNNIILKVCWLVLQQSLNWPYLKNANKLKVKMESYNCFIVHNVCLREINLFWNICCIIELLQEYHSINISNN